LEIRSGELSDAIFRVAREEINVLLDIVWADNDGMSISSILIPEYEYRIDILDQASKYLYR